jgi:hypothetical protein
MTSWQFENRMHDVKLNSFNKEGRGHQFQLGNRRWRKIFLACEKQEARYYGCTTCKLATAWKTCICDCHHHCTTRNDVIPGAPATFLTTQELLSILFSSTPHTNTSVYFPSDRLFSLKSLRPYSTRALIKMKLFSQILVFGLAADLTIASTWFSKAGKYL